MLFSQIHLVPFLYFKIPFHKDTVSFFVEIDFLLHCSGRDSVKTWIQQRPPQQLGWALWERLRELGMCSLPERWLQWDLTAAPSACAEISEQTEPGFQCYTAEGQEEMGINWNKTGHKATLFPWERSSSRAGCPQVVRGLHSRRFLRIDWAKTIEIWSELFGISLSKTNDKKSTVCDWYKHPAIANINSFPTSAFAIYEFQACIYSYLPPALKFINDLALFSINFHPISFCDS